MSYDYVVHQGKRLFVIDVKKSDAEVSLGGKVYVRTGDRTTLKQAGPVKAIRNAGIDRLSKALKEDRKSCTAARAKLLDHYESVLRILDDLGKLLYPKAVQASRPTMLKARCSCASSSRPARTRSRRSCRTSCTRSTSRSPRHSNRTRPVTVKEVLDCSDMQEFISRYAKEKLKKLQRGSVKGFIADNQAIKSLNVFDATRQEEIEKILQIRHLYTHQNGIVDDKFRKSFPATKVNDEYRMTLDEFLDRFEYLAQAIEAVDEAARKDFKLAVLLIEYLPSGRAAVQ